MFQFGRVAALLIASLALMSMPVQTAGIGDLLEKAGRKLGRIVEPITSPIHKEVNSFYDKNLRSTYHNVKNSFESALPSGLRETFRTNIAPLVRPAYTLGWEVPVGRVDLGEGLESVYDDFKASLSNTFVLPELLALYATTKARSQPLPEWVESTLATNWPECAGGRPLLTSQARYVVSPTLVGVLTGGSRAAIVFYDVIVLRDPLVPSSRSGALLAHEMVHVAQFAEVGINRFLADYYVGSVFEGFELEAHRFEEEGAAVQSCFATALAGQVMSGANMSAHLSVAGPAGRYSPFRMAVTAYESGGRNGTDVAEPYALRAVQSGDAHELMSIISWVWSNPAASPADKASLARTLAISGATVFGNDPVAWAQVAVSWQPSDVRSCELLGLVARQHGRRDLAAHAFVNAAMTHYWQPRTPEAPDLEAVEAALRDASDVALTQDLKAHALVMRAALVDEPGAPVTLNDAEALADEAISAVRGVPCSSVQLRALHAHADYRYRQALRDQSRLALSESGKSASDAYNIANTCFQELVRDGFPDITGFMNTQSQRINTIQQALRDPRYR